MSEKYLLDGVKARICKSAHKAGRKMDNICLIGASKHIEPEVLKRFYDVGLKSFGENRVQELKAKVSLLPADCEWHFIGGLQTNKVRDAIRFSSLIHSVDRAELIEEIENRSSQFGKTQRILIEVNVGGEVSKHGVEPSNALSLVQLANQKSHIEVIGFMTVAPFHEDIERVRPYFRRLRELRDQIQKESGFILPELSMGMSHDFEIAVEEGATIVRVGAALFGERKK